jgi:hypothetical protein
MLQGRVRAVAGASGGTKIITATAQVSPHFLILLCHIFIPTYSHRHNME